MHAVRLLVSVAPRKIDEVPKPAVGPKAAMR